MDRGCISVQLFTVRKYMKTPQQIKKTLKRLGGLGYNYIEVARIKFNEEEGQAIKEACDEYGIRVGSTQIKYKEIIKNFDLLVKLHKMWNCQYIAVSVLPTKHILQGEAGIRNFAPKLNELGKRLAGHGLNLLYHHHDMEFVRYDGKTGLEILMEETDPDYVNLMMDTYWTQKGGRNPVAQIRQFAERIKVIHLRDYRTNFAYRKGGFYVEDCPLFEGNLDMKAIVETAREVGVPYLPVEQATDHPFEDLKISMTNLRHAGLTE